MKLNTDGCLKASTNKAAAGGLIRSHTGTWMGGFLANLGSCSVLAAECWGVIHGLRLAWELGIRSVILEVDNSCVVNIIQGQTSCPLQSLSLIHEIKSLLNKDWMVQVAHIYREANYCADYLANVAIQSSLGCVYLDRPPSGIQNLLFNDMVGVATPRQCLL